MFARRLDRSFCNTVRRTASFSLVLYFAVLCSSCSKSSLLPNSSRCTLSSECASGACHGGICVPTCTGDSDCSGTDLCGDSGMGFFLCLLGCEEPYSLCEGGRPVTCISATQEHCSSCGCPVGLRCDVSGACMAISDVGGNCLLDSDCTTLNCSTFAGVCRVPVGAECTSANCDQCLVASSFTFCSRECGHGFSESCSTYPCIETSVLTEDIGNCYPRCRFLSEPFCPDTCQYDADHENIYCDCSHTFCPAELGIREVGHWCRSQSYCRSGQCYRRSKCEYGNTECTVRGWCTTGCSSDAECAAGTRCVDIPCIGSSSECGQMCLPTCATDSDCRRGNSGFSGHPGGITIGECVSRRLVEGGQSGVCDVKLRDGTTGCLGANDCFSGDCTNGTCGDVDAAPNGAPCGLPQDCSSYNCVTGTCRGTVVIGDWCGTDVDCAEGLCCLVGSDHVCRVSC